MCRNWWSKCFYINKPDFLYPSIENNNNWCQWQHHPGQSFQFRIWDGVLNCCLKTSENSFAHFYYIQFKQIYKKSTNLLVSTLIRSEINDYCNCKKRSGIKDGIINQLILEL